MQNFCSLPHQGGDDHHGPMRVKGPANMQREQEAHSNGIGYDGVTTIRQHT